MPDVTCPSCSTRQPIASGSRGYTCAECGIEWRLVACARCGKRFHSRSTATAWTCPSCDLAQEVEPQDEHPAERPLTAQARSTRALAGDNRSTRLAMLAAGIVVVVLGSFLLTRGGSDGSGGGSTGGGGVLAAACVHKLDIGEFRYDALLRNEATFRKDATALEQDGQTPEAAKFTALADALHEYALILRDSGDTTDVAAAMQDTLLALPC